MKETLQPIIEQAIAQLQQGADWLSGEIPLYIQELLKWHFTMSLIWFMVGVLFAVLTIVWLVFCKRWFGIDKFWEDKTRTMPCQFSTGIICIASLFATPSLIFSNLTWIKILIAPRVFLVEYLSNLI